MFFQHTQITALFVLHNVAKSITNTILYNIITVIIITANINV